MILDFKVTRGHLFCVGFITHESTGWVANFSDENYNTHVGLCAKKASHTWKGHPAWMLHLAGDGHSTGVCYLTYGDLNAFSTYVRASVPIGTGIRVRPARYAKAGFKAKLVASPVG